MKIDQYISWSMLGRIGRSSVSKLSILMPFIGYIIILQDNVISFLDLMPIHSDRSDLKFGIGFYFLYFGLFIFGFASFIFQVAAPETAKNFKSADDYVERLQLLATASELREKNRFVLQHVEPDSADEKESQLYKSTLSAGVGGQPEPAVRIFVLRKFFEINDQSRIILRCFVFLLFSVGIVLTLIPSLIALSRIISDFSKNFL